MNNEDVYSSDDEVYVGNLTLKEIKKRFGLTTHRQTMPCESTLTTEDCNTSLKLLETKSEPDIASVISPKLIKSTNRPDIIDELEDESFLQLEKLVAEIEMSPNNLKKEELDNTLNAVDLILKQGRSCSTIINDHINDMSQIPFQESIETKKVVLTSPVSQYCTPMKHLNPFENVKTSLSKTKLKSPCFKTPANPMSIKKPSLISVKKTPSKNSYQHITSPIAAYIKNSPQVPLVNDVHPKKPLPGVSFIPKLLKPKQMHNKENINLPTLEYKPAKTVKV